MDKFDKALLGAGAGSGNGSGSANKGTIQASLLSWKPTTTEVHQHIHVTNHEGNGTAATALMVTGGLAVGAAVMWTAGKILTSKTEITVDTRELEEGELGDEEEKPVEETTTHISAKMQLEILRKKRRRMAAA